MTRVIADGPDAGLLLTAVDGKPAIRVIAESATANVLEIIRADGTVLYALDKTGTPSTGGGGGSSTWTVPTGLVGNGIADDTTAIATALAGLPATGGTVFLPPGTYKTTATLDLGTNKRLIGSGRYATIISYTGSSIAINMGVATQTVAPPSGTAGVFDLKINGAGQTTSGSVGIRVIKLQFPTIERVAIENIESALVFDASDLWVADGHVLNLTTNQVAAGVTFTGQTGKQVNQIFFFGGYIGGSNVANGFGIKLGGTSFYAPAASGFLGGGNKFFGTMAEGFLGTNGVGFNVAESGDPGNAFYNCGSEACTNVNFVLGAGSVRNVVQDYLETITDGGIANKVSSMSTVRAVMRGLNMTTTTAIDMTDGEVRSGFISGATAFSNPTNAARGMKLKLIMQSSGGSAVAPTWGSAFVVDPTWTSAFGTVSGKWNTIEFVYEDITSGGKWFQVGGRTNM
jgi:hypothetical protein